MVASYRRFFCYNRIKEKNNSNYSCRLLRWNITKKKKVMAASGRWFFRCNRTKKKKAMTTIVVAFFVAREGRELNFKFWL
jgi:hypothetical protein